MASENAYPRLDSTEAPVQDASPSTNDFANQIRARLADLQSQLDRRIEVHAPHADRVKQLLMEPETGAHLKVEPAGETPQRVTSTDFIHSAPAADASVTRAKAPWTLSSAPTLKGGTPEGPGAEDTRGESVKDIESEFAKPSPPQDAEPRPEAVSAVGAAAVAVEIRRVEIERQLEQERASIRAERAKLVAEAKVQSTEILKRAEQEADAMLAQAQKTIDEMFALATAAYERQTERIRELEDQYDRMLERMRTLLEEQLASLPYPRGAAFERSDVRPAMKVENGGRSRENRPGPTTERSDDPGERPLRQLPKHYSQEF